jgi:hypothetical protein
MNEFVFLFRASDESAQAAMGTPEAAQRAMAAWLGWIRSLESNGHLKNPGQPLARSGKVVRGSKKVVIDGPFVESKDMVLGFIIVSARDMKQAIELANGCPMLLGEGSVEIRPVDVLPATA